MFSLWGVGVDPRTPQKRASIQDLQKRLVTIVFWFLDFENLGDFYKIRASGPGDEYDVFESHTAHPGVIESGFNRNDMSGPETGCMPCIDPRSFMDIQTQSVASPVEKTLHPSVPGAGVESFVFEIAED